MSETVVSGASVGTGNKYEVLWIEGNDEHFRMPNASFRAEALGIVVPESSSERLNVKDAVAALLREVFLMVNGAEVGIGRAWDWPQGYGLERLKEVLPEVPRRLAQPITFRAGELMGFRVEGEGPPLRIILSGRWEK